MIVIFDPEEFKKLYPEYASIPDERLELYFRAACLLLNNTDKSPVRDPAERKTLLYLLVCHIAELKSRGNSTVGMLTSAAEGSVNVSVSPLNKMNWYTLTQCGSIYWAATAKYRCGVRWFSSC